MSGPWQLRRDERDILWVGLDYADGPVNLLSREVLGQLDGHLAQMELAPPKSLILHSLKNRGFVAGADVREFTRLKDPDRIAAHIRRVHRVLDRLEALPCPTLALIHGFCLGGGLELALACRYRVATDCPETRIGFPEVRLGIFPAYGGTWRGMRTIGALPALKMMLSGRALRADEAQRSGLVDLVVPRRQLESAALKLLDAPPRPGRASAGQRLIGVWPLRCIAAWYLDRRSAGYLNPDHYPAPFSLVDHWREWGADGPALLRSEAVRVSQLLRSRTARNLIRVFHLQERLKGLGRGGDYTPRQVQVVGAGAMGGDIAAWCALQGCRVGLQDLSSDQLGHALKRARGLFERRLRDPRLVRDAWDRLMPDPRGNGLRQADLVIEAVVEDAGVKGRLLREIEASVRTDSLLASNTSSIPLETLGEGLTHPERLIGLHFFNPVARMQLVEVVQGRDTSREFLQQGLSFVRSIDRLPLPVRSSPGFLVNRVLIPYLLEALDLLEEGVPAEVIDRAALNFGMPMGPIALADSVGLDICLAVTEKLGKRLTAPEQTPERLKEMVRQGLLGRKAGAGFYNYKDGKPVKRRAYRGYHPPPDLAERMIFRLLNEAVACLRERIVEDEDLLDAGVVFGTGFAPFRGGPMRYIEEGGWSEMRSRLEALQKDHGRHFRPDRGWSRPLRV